MATGETLGKEARDGATEGMVEMVKGAADTGTDAALDELSEEDQ